MAENKENASAEKSADVKKLEEAIVQKDKAIADLQAAIKTKDEKITYLESEIATGGSAEEISELPKTKTHQFTVEKFRFKGADIKAEDAVNDKELMKTLVEIGFVGLKKIK